MSTRSAHHPDNPVRKAIRQQEAAERQAIRTERDATAQLAVLAARGVNITSHSNSREVLRLREQINQEDLGQGEGI